MEITEFEKIMPVVNLINVLYFNAINYRTVLLDWKIKNSKDCYD